MTPPEEETKTILFLQLQIKGEKKKKRGKEAFQTQPWASLLWGDYIKQQHQRKHDSFKRLSNTCFHSAPVPGLGFPSHNGNVYLLVSVSALTCFIFFLLRLLLTLSFLQAH